MTFLYAFLGIIAVLALGVIALVLAADRIADRENRKRDEQSEPR